LKPREATRNDTLHLAKLAVAWSKAFAVYFPGPAEEIGKLGAEILLDADIRYWISPWGDSITCVTCRLTSRHPDDVRNHYCGHCHVFHDDDPQPPDQA
jgi:hypothetical protein